MAGKLLLAVGLSLAALALAVAWLAARHEARAETSHPPQGQILDIGGHRVHALVMGSGPDLVLIHGASGNLRDITFSLAPRLAERYRVIVIDRPGLGYTDRINRSGASIAQQAELLMQTARHLGAERPIVLGHTYGGAVALAWAAYYPEDLSALVAVVVALDALDNGARSALPGHLLLAGRGAGGAADHRLRARQPGR